MISHFYQFVNSLNKPKYYLILANILLVFFAILLTNLGILPFKRMGDFAFFAGIGLILALYRPGWGFLFFIGTIALENINVAPVDFPISIRPYQFFGAVTIAAVAIRYFSGRLSFKLIKLKWFNYLLVIFAIASFTASYFSIEKGLAFKQSVILVSFVFLYFLVRNYVQTLEDLKKIIPIFLSSSVIVIFYGIWQNVRFAHNLNSFEVMPGRPNATFTEADWLGIYLVFLIACIYTMIYYFSNKDSADKKPLIFNFQFSIFNKFLISKFQIFNLFLYLSLITSYVLLILTVSRSAWLGAAIITIIFLKIILTKLSWHPKDWQWKQFINQSVFLAIALFAAFFFVYIFHLTNFQLFNRVQSTGSGLQKITISCSLGSSTSKLLPLKTIKDVSELKIYDCRHINLEDIEKEKAAGMNVYEVYRQDPNVNIRKEIYQKSWNEIKKHPVMGIGWGSIGKILGTDEHGTSLNSSNIILEVWLGSGVVGLLAFVVFLGYILVSCLKNLFKKENGSIILNVFIILAFWAILVPNLFNAGMLLGILWLFFALSQIENKEVR
jgi:hypothetical protein